MGVVHLAPIGASPGAVTAGLAYLKENGAQFGGYKGQQIESIVLFAPHQLHADECVLNNYGEVKSNKRWQKQDRAMVWAVVREFVIHILAPAMPHKGALYLVEIDPYDLESSFDTVAHTTLALAQREADDTGKHLWANLTGGTNVLNAALMQVATLSGLIARAYYTFLDDDRDRKFLQPATRDERYFRWVDVPLFKSIFDSAYYRVLQVLGEFDWCSDVDLWEWLKADEQVARYYGEVTLAQFRAQLLNRMDGREVERNSPTGHQVRLSPIGRATLARLDQPLFKALVQRGQKTELDVQASYRDLQSKIIWEKA